MNTKKALVLGATGGIGSEVAKQLHHNGWSINALKRGKTMPLEREITWFSGDAMKEQDVANAAQGCQVIVHAVNPAGYKHWQELVLPMIDNTIKVAKALGACIVLPGNIYNYGPDAFPLLTESSPQNPLTRKGKIRVELERRLEAFANQGGHVIIVRAGDFFGPNTANNWLSQGLIKPHAPIRKILNPVMNDQGHHWAYLPDVAETIVKLIECRQSLPPFSTFHMKGFWDKDGHQLSNRLAQIVAQKTGTLPRVKAFPWWIMHLLSPFNETIRELVDMKYLWRTEIQMDNTKLRDLLGHEPSTDIRVALEETLIGLKCL